MIYIISGNIEEFNKYLKECTLSSDEYQYVKGPEDFDGLENVNLFYVGSWCKRNDLNKIQEKIKIINSKRIR